VKSKDLVVNTDIDSNIAPHCVDILSVVMLYVLIFFLTLHVSIDRIQRIVVHLAAIG
jgi:hypothetical protein